MFISILTNNMFYIFINLILNWLYDYAYIGYFGCKTYILNIFCQLFSTTFVFVWHSHPKFKILDPPLNMVDELGNWEINM